MLPWNRKGSDLRTARSRSDLWRKRQGELKSKSKNKNKKCDSAQSRLTASPGFLRETDFDSSLETYAHSNLRLCFHLQDVIRGNAGPDTLYGKAGKDLILGGFGEFGTA